MTFLDFFRSFHLFTYHFFFPLGCWEQPGRFWHAEHDCEDDRPALGGLSARGLESKVAMEHPKPSISSIKGKPHCHV